MIPGEKQLTLYIQNCFILGMGLEQKKKEPNLHNMFKCLSGRRPVGKFIFWGDRIPEQIAVLEKGINFTVIFDLGKRDAPHQMPGSQLFWTMKAHGSQNLRKTFDRRFLEIGDTLVLVRHHQAVDQIRILRRHTRRAMIGVALKRLDASQGQHHAA